VAREAKFLAQVLWFFPLNFTLPLLHVRGGWGPPRAVEPMLMMITACSHSFICHRFCIVQIVGQHPFFMVDQILVFIFLMGNCSWLLVKATTDGNKSFMNPLFLHCIINMLCLCSNSNPFISL